MLENPPTHGNTATGDRCETENSDLVAILLLDVLIEYKIANEEVTIPVLKPLIDCIGSCCVVDACQTSDKAE